MRLLRLFATLAVLGFAVPIMAQSLLPVALPDAGTVEWDLSPAARGGDDCTGEESVANDNVTSYLPSNPGGLLIGQGFTAPCTGLISRVVVVLYTDGDSPPSNLASGNLLIFEGAGTEGTQLVAEPYSFSPPDTLNTFEEREIAILSDVPVTAGEAYTFVTEQLDGELQLVVDGDASYGGGELHFTKDGEVSTMQSQSDFDMVFMVNFAAPLGTAGEAGAVPGVYAISAVYPNPLTACGSFILDLERSQDVRIAAYDVLGREVAVLHEGALAADRHTLSLSTSTWPSGIYFVSVRGEEFSTTRKFVVAH